MTAVVPVAFTVDDTQFVAVATCAGEDCRRMFTVKGSNLHADRIPEQQQRATVERQLRVNGWHDAAGLAFCAGCAPAVAPETPPPFPAPPQARRARQRASQKP